jgi:hypothetical protein
MSYDSMFWVFPENPQQRPEKVVRLTLPFSLRKNGIPRGPTEEELPELQRLFPTLKTISFKLVVLELVLSQFLYHNHAFLDRLR